MELNEQDLNFNIKLDDTTDSKNEEQKSNQQKQQNNQGKDELNNEPKNIQNQQQPQQQGFLENYNLKKSGHPIICLLTFSFKLAAFLCYFVIGDSSEVTTFILTTLFSSFDFWATKNISGRYFFVVVRILQRKLIGLRYWSDFNEQGNIVWIFESPNQQFKSNPIDASFFWTFQIVGTFFWGLIFIFKLISFHFLWVTIYQPKQFNVIGTIMCNVFCIMLCQFTWIFQMSWWQEIQINLVIISQIEHKKKVNELTKKGLIMIGQKIFQNEVMK